jgi:transcriptional regulator
MYVPAHFKVDDPVILKEFVEANAFATLITQGDGRPFASHLPLLTEGEGLTHFVGHMARANPQWQHLENGSELLMIFHGPHAYISPFWYEAAEAVPTWNYAAVHVYGRARIIEDDYRSRSIVERLTRKYEGARADALLQRWSEPFLAKMLKSIVAFEVETTRVEGKWKLGQNRNAADVAGTYRALTASSDPADRALAGVMSDFGLLTDPGTSR